MNLGKGGIPVFVLAVMVGFFPWAAQAAGLSTEHGEIRLEGLQIGRRYGLKEVMGHPFQVENTSPTESVSLTMEVLVPQPSELKDSFEVIPALSWISLERSEFQIKPQETATTDLVLDIPDDPSLQGRRFQAYLWAHTTGGTVGVGLRSRLLLEMESYGERKEE